MRTGVWFALMLSCGVAQADPPDCANAAERLHSEPKSEKAWGAYLAAKCHLPELAADIARELDAKYAGFVWDSEPFWLGRALLDALIQLRQPLDSSVLASLAEGYRTEAAILMLQYPAANCEALAALRAGDPKGDDWVPASNALATMRAPGFAAALLHEVHIRQRIWVRGDAEPQFPGTAGSGLSSNPVMKVPPGFPPIGLYRLVAQAAEGDELVADGTTPMYSQRTIVEPGKEVTWQTGGQGYCYQCLRIGYLAELARVSVDEARQAVEADTTVRWSNSVNLAVEISRALESQKTALQHLASAAGVTASEGMILQIVVEMMDQRSDRSVPLPAVSAMEIHLP